MIQNQNFHYYFTEASYVNGQYRWAATCSDTSIDTYTERMSVDLFNSFITNWNKENKYKIYGSLSHYPSLSGLAEWGEVTELYIDGDRLKAKGIFYDTSLGRAVYNSIKADKANDIPADKRVRVSNGFYATRYHIGDKVWIFGETPELLEAAPGEVKVYDEGLLEHLAVTRVPANKRVSIHILDEKSERSDMSNPLRREDALSIVNDPQLVDEIEQKLAEQPTEKSGNRLVEKADSDSGPTGPVRVIDVLDLLKGLTAEEARTGLETLFYKMN